MVVQEKSKFEELVSIVIFAVNSSSDIKRFIKEKKKNSSDMILLNKFICTFICEGTME